MKKIELLAPAKDLACGIAAIDHGADAVYIGAQRFGARAAAGNSIDDIAALCSYAHKFGAKVYATVNTIIYDNEMDDVCNLMKELDAVGVDAFLVQDMRLVGQLHSLSSHLHASTQTDNRNTERVRKLHDMGFTRVVLARELSLEEIAAIHKAVPDVELEVFVHGALCVSYSGACYASQYCFGRSANRGECAQFCRLRFSLKDAEGKVVEHERHLLSLKDMCRIDYLEELLEAGAVSLKIEGRLKDVGYVKNVVAAYSQRLDEIIERNHGKYERASHGRCKHTFVPNLRKTFNRGYTDYFLHGRRNDIASFDTPKAIGEQVGTVKSIGTNGSIVVAGATVFANGDGLCFMNDRHELVGFRVNRVEGNRLYLMRTPNELRKGMTLYRNHDAAFTKLLSGKTAERRMHLTMTMRLDDTNQIVLAGMTENGTQERVTLDVEQQKAQKNQRENIIRQLQKLGNTPYECTDIRIEDNIDNLFIPSSILADARRQLVDRLGTMAYNDSKQDKVTTPATFDCDEIENEDHLNATCPSLLMQCRHCLRYSLGYCVKNGGRKPLWKEPLRLELGDGRTFRLEFDCRNCQMNIYTDRVKEIGRRKRHEN